MLLPFAQRDPRVKPATGLELDLLDPINRGLGARYLFNEGAGTSFFDVGPRRLRGSITNATWATTPQPPLGGMGRCLSFDNSGDTLNFGSGSWSNAVTGMSIAAWVRVASLANYDSMFCRGTWAADWASHTGSDGKIWWGYSDADRVVAPANTLTTNTWIFIVLSMIDRRWRVYKNGVQVADGAAAATSMPTSTRDVTFSTWIGAGNSDYNGFLSQVIFYSRALSLQEIRRLYYDPTAGLKSARWNWPAPLTAAPVEELAAPVTAQSQVLGVLRKIRSASSAVTAQSEVLGVLRKIRSAAAAVTAQSEVLGVLRKIRSASSAVTAQSQVLGALRKIRSASSAVTAQSAAAGALRNTHSVVAAILAASEILGDLTEAGTVYKDMLAAILAQSQTAGTVKKTRSIAGATAGRSAILSPLRKTTPVAASVAEQSALLAGLEAIRRLAAAVQAQSAVAGGLTEMLAFDELSALVEAQSAITARMQRGTRFESMIDAPNFGSQKIDTGLPKAQTFRPQVTHFLREIDLRLTGNDVTPTAKLTVGVYATDGDGKPTGAALSEYEHAYTQGYPAWPGSVLSIEMPQILLTAETLYAIVCSHDNNGNETSWIINVSAPSPYSRGRNLGWNNLTSTWDFWDADASDFWFAEYGVALISWTELEAAISPQSDVLGHLRQAPRLAAWVSAQSRVSARIQHKAANYVPAQVLTEPYPIPTLWQYLAGSGALSPGSREWGQMFSQGVQEWAAALEQWSQEHMTRVMRDMARLGQEKTTDWVDA